MKERARTIESAFWLLRAVTVPSIRRHIGGGVLTLAGVAIGIQVVVAVALINRSVLSSFEHTITTIAGGADLIVANGTVGVPEDLIEKIASAPGVATAAGLIQGNLSTEWGDLAVFGVDLLGDQSIRQIQFPREHVHITDDLRFLNAEDSIAATTTFLTKAGLAVGDTVPVLSPSRATTVVVRGTLDPAGPAKLFGGHVGLVDLPTAQRLFGRGSRVDEIDVMLDPQADAAVVTTALQRIVDGAGLVEPPGKRAAALGSMLGAVQTIFTLLSLAAVIIGSFIVHHALRTAIAARRKDLALSRAIGYRRGAVTTAIALEAAAYGAGGAALGALFGALAARLSLNVAASGISAIWAPVDASGLALEPADLLLAFALGIGSAIAACMAPAREMARLQIVAELREDHALADPASRGWTSATLGVVLTACGLALFHPPIRPTGHAGTIAVTMSAVLLTALGYTALLPHLVRAGLLVLEPLTSLFTRTGADLAASNLRRDARKLRSVTAALMLAFALVLIVNSFVRSLRGSILSWVDQTLVADLQITRGMELDLPSGPTLPRTLADRIQTTEGVESVGIVRMQAVRVGDAMAVLRAESLAALRRQRYPLVGGNIDLAGFAHGTSVLVSDNFAYRHDVGAGDRLTLQTPSGERSFVIAGVIVDYTLDIGTIVIAHETFRDLWNDDLASSFRVWLRPGTDIDTARTAIRRRVGPEIPVTVLTAGQFKTTLTETLNRALLLTNAIQFVAVGIAVIGVINFFLTQIYERRREIGLLRSVALNPTEIRWLLSWESALLGLIGGTIAILFAWPVSYLLVTSSTRLVSGWSLTFEFSSIVAVATVLVACATSLVAVQYPARAVAHQTIAQLVATE